MKYLKFTIFLITLFILLAFKEAHAAFIFQRPLYLGLGSGLVGNWTFDGPDMAGVTAYDRSPVGTNHGTLTGGPARALGAVGQALSFDGVDDLVNAGNPASLQITGSMTVSAWVKADSFPASNDARIITKFGAIAGWSLGTTYDNGSNQFLIYFKSGGVDKGRYSATIPQTGLWYHVVGVIDTGTPAVDIYVNGALNNNQLLGTGASIDDVATNINIGRRNESGFYQYWNGLIDEVRVYNRALSFSEIQALYQQGSRKAQFKQ